MFVKIFETIDCGQNLKKKSVLVQNFEKSQFLLKFICYFVKEISISVKIF